MEAAQAKVWNDHSKEYREMFRDEEIVIPAKDFIIMPWQDAVMFRGQYTPIQRDGLGNDLKPKMIRLEKVEANAVEYPVPKEFVCQRDGQKFATQEALDAHIAANYLEDMADDDARQKLKEKASKKV